MASQLIDCSTFFLDENIFINIGLDTVSLLNCVVHFNVNSQRVKMSTEFFQSLIPLLDRKTFMMPKYLYCEEYKEVTITQCNGSNVLSIRCLLDDQCIKLSEENALRLTHVKDDIQEVIKIKVNETRPKVLLEACEICKYLGTSMPFPKDTELCHLEYYLLRIDPATLSNNLPVWKPCFVAQLTLHATSQLARGWLGASVMPEVIQTFFFFFIILFYTKVKLIVLA